MSGEAAASPGGRRRANVCTNVQTFARFRAADVRPFERTFRREAAKLLAAEGCALTASGGALDAASSDAAGKFGVAGSDPKFDHFSAKPGPSGYAPSNTPERINAVLDFAIRLQNHQNLRALTSPPEATVCRVLRPARLYTFCDRQNRNLQNCDFVSQKVYSQSGLVLWAKVPADWLYTFSRSRKMQNFANFATQNLLKVWGFDPSQKSQTLRKFLQICKFFAKLQKFAQGLRFLLLVGRLTTDQLKVR